MRIMLIASSGGHWVQLMRLRPAWSDLSPIYVTTNRDYISYVFEESETNDVQFYTVMPANQWNKIKIFLQAVQILILVIKTRPEVILSTGASPGFFGLMFGKLLLRSRTIWIDSIANVDGLSLSGKKSRAFADLWLTQWEEVAETDQKLSYLGSVM